MIKDAKKELEKYKDFGCSQCGACVGACSSYYNNTKTNPRKIVHISKIYKMNEDFFEYFSKVEEDIDACLQCGICEVYCPNKNNPGKIIKSLKNKDKNLSEFYKEILGDKGHLPLLYNKGEFKILEINRREISDRALEELKGLLYNNSDLNLKINVNTKVLPKDMSANKYDEIYNFQSCGGCIAAYPTIEKCTDFILEKIGIKNNTSDNQTCCGGALFHANLLNYEDIVKISVRNMSEIENIGQEYVISSCPNCVITNMEVQELLGNKENRKIIDKLLPIKYETGDSLDFGHIIEVYLANKDYIVENIEDDLKEIRVSIHPGCQLLRIYGFKGKKMLTDLLKYVGVEEVYYGRESMCCGGGPNLLTGKDIGNITYKKLKHIEEQCQPIDALITVCPGCESVYDSTQQAVRERFGLLYEIPILHISEFLALIMGADPHKVVGTQYHSISPTSLNNKIKL